MTDLEMTLLCADAIGISHKVSRDDQEDFIEILDPRNPGNGGEYSPLRNDTQAMELVKNLGLTIFLDSRLPRKTWRVFWSSGLDDACSSDLNRAICECVAKLHSTRQGEK